MSLDRFGDAAALVTDGDLLTYAGLAARADDWVSATRRVHWQRPEPPLVALEITNSIAAIAAYIGCLRAGWPVVLLQEGQGAPSGPILERYQPNIVVQIAGSDMQVRVQSSARCEFAPGLAVLLSTSGTTGATKLVRLSQENIHANATSIAQYLRVTPDDAAITTLPLHYSYGLSVLHTHLLMGARLLLTDLAITQGDFWRVARDGKATSLALVPTQFELLAKSGFEADRLPSLRYMTQAGGRFDPSLARRFAQAAREQGWQLFIMYGQTEASPRIAYVPPEDALDHADTIGRPIPGGALWLEDANGAPIDQVGVAGELVYRGPNVMMGYASARDELSLPPGEPILRTGDIAEKLDSGYFRIVGRASRFVKLLGLRVSLDEIESRLRSDGGGFVVSGNDRGVVIFAQDEAYADARARNVLRARVATLYKLPENLIFVSPLAGVPLLASGKVDYRTLSDLAALAMTTGTTAQVERDATAELKRILRRDTLDTNRSFEELGGDSLAYLEVELLLNERLGSAPPRWEAEPLGRLLAAMEQPATAIDGPAGPTLRFGTPIGPDLVVRLVALTCVILLHTTSLAVGGGVFILTMLVGYSLARFQRLSLTSGRVAEVIVTMVLPITAAYYAVVIPLDARFDIDWRWYTPVANFHVLGRQIPEPRILLPYWYVSAYIQLILLFCLPFSFSFWRRMARAQPFLLGMGLTITFGALTLLTSAGDLRYGTQVRHPLGAMELASVGWCLATADTGRRKLAAAALLLVSFAVLWRDADPSVTVFMTLVPLFILWSPKVLVPARLARLLLALGSLTLYVYIAHVPGKYIATHFLDSQAAIFAATLGISLVAGALLKKALSHPIEAAVKRLRPTDS